MNNIVFEQDVYKRQTQGGPNYASSNLIYASYHEAFTSVSYTHLQKQQKQLKCMTRATAYL